VASLVEEPGRGGITFGSDADLVRRSRSDMGYLMARGFAARAAARILLATRWWVGTTWLVAGVGGVCAGPVMVATGDAGGLYMITGGLTVAWLGQAIHPAGSSRRLRRRIDQRERGS
jgi:hypothetical protein